MADLITTINAAVNNFIWGVPAMICIIGVGLLLSVRTRFIQIRKFPYAIKTTIGRMFRKKDASDGTMTPFQAVCTALAGTVGTGNIAGVAGAIAIGGPGALFWMVVAAFLGMATKYSEGLLAVKYRTVAEDGHSLGGPFYYIELGMGKNFKWLAKIFAFFGVCVGLFGIGTFSQVNGISSAVHGFFDPNDAFTVKILPFLGEYSWSVVIASLILSFCVAAVLIGGVKRIASVSQIIVPFMAVIYFVFAVILICCNITKVPAAFATIVTAAFSPKAITGGPVGNKPTSIPKGVARRIFFKADVLGNAPLDGRAATAQSPVLPGLVSRTRTVNATNIHFSLTGFYLFLIGA